MAKKLKYIKCPKCGYEYLAAEILIPKIIFGQPKEIIRKTDGTIDFYLGEEPDLHDSYICDKCGATFNIDVDITFNCTLDQECNFSEDYSSTIYKNRIELPEKESLFDK